VRYNRTRHIISNYATISVHCINTTRSAPDAPVLEKAGQLARRSVSIDAIPNGKLRKQQQEEEMPAVYGPGDQLSLIYAWIETHG
jgi:hypothetical protein